MTFGLGMGQELVSWLVWAHNSSSAYTALATAQRPDKAMDIQELLEPISAGAPCGEDLSFSPEFDAIARLRVEDDPTLDQGEWATELRVADWNGVAQKCEALLRTRTKDLRVAGWWADAAIRQRGFAGMAEGLRLVSALVRDFWEAVHPQIEDGDVETRVGNLSWVLARAAALSGTAIVATVGRQRLGLVDIDRARARAAAGPAAAQTAAEKDAARPAALEYDAIVRAVAAAGATAYQGQLEAAKQALIATEELKALVDERLGSDGPPFAKAREAIEQSIDSLQRLGRDAGLGAVSAAGEDDSAAAPDESSAGAPQGLAPGPGRTAAAFSPGEIQTRAQALQQLRQVANFFRRTEPHSPVAYLADKAARWGDLPLHAWLRQVVKDDAALARLEELLGVEPPAANPSP